MGPGGRHGLSEGFKRIVRKAGPDLQTVQGNGKERLLEGPFTRLDTALRANWLMQAYPRSYE